MAGSSWETPATSRIQERVREVAGVSQEDPAIHHGGIWIERPWKDLRATGERRAGSQQHQYEEDIGDAERPRHHPRVANREAAAPDESGQAGSGHEAEPRDEG